MERISLFIFCQIILLSYFLPSSYALYLILYQKYRISSSIVDTEVERKVNDDLNVEGKLLQMRLMELFTLERSISTIESNNSAVSAVDLALGLSIEGDALIALESDRENVVDKFEF